MNLINLIPFKKFCLVRIQFTTLTKSLPDLPTVTVGGAIARQTLELLPGIPNQLLARERRTVRPIASRRRRCSVLLSVVQLVAYQPFDKIGRSSFLFYFVDEFTCVGSVTVFVCGLQWYGKIRKNLSFIPSELLFYTGLKHDIMLKFDFFYCSLLL